MSKSTSRDVESGVLGDDEGIPLIPRVASEIAGVTRGDRRTLQLEPFPHSHYDVKPHRLLQISDAATPCSNQSTPGSTPTTTNSEYPRKWRRSDRRVRRLNTELLEAVDAKDLEEIEKLISQGANPNATCRLDLVSACHYAALVGGNTLETLIKYGAEGHRLDKLGRTPLHLAVWAGNVREVAILLDFPEEIQERVSDETLSSGAEEEIRKISEKTRKMANVPCDLGEVKTFLPKDWKDNIDHDCRDISGSFPLFKPGWTPLHVASATARLHCAKLLLAAGASPNASDVLGCTPLDVAGIAYYHELDIDVQNLTEVIKLLIQSGSQHKTMRSKGINNIDTPLHIAAELEALEALKSLLDAGASVSCLNTAGLTPLHICVKKQLEEPLQILANLGVNDVDPLAAAVDVKDSEGHTVLQASVEAAWVGGVCAALEAGADVSLKANDGETPIHSAAALGDLDVLNEILSVARQKSSLDCQNFRGETPLFIAVKKENLLCVKAILTEGASIKITLPNDISIFHIAAEIGNVDIMKILVEHDSASTISMINSLTSENDQGFGPIHYAVYKNHPNVVEYLLKNGADVRLRTTAIPAKASTPLHLAAVRNYMEIAHIILRFDKTTLHEVNILGWFPLHSAAHHGNRDVIAALLQAGADLSGFTDGPKKMRKTAINMIIYNLPKPTEYLEELFDSYMTTTCSDVQDEDCIVKLDYSILMPKGCEMEQMTVIKELLKTGNRFNQKRLLVHPLLESFLYFKWKALLPFFYTILACYACFLSSLTIFVVSVFFYKDTAAVAPVWLNPQIWSAILSSTIILIILQELFMMNIINTRYFSQMESIIKVISVCLASILPATPFIDSWYNAEWPRHVATLALLLSWIEMMYLLSRFPNWGYYVLMFGKVASNVVKILLTFAFLVIGFTLSFMVQFHAMPPFDGIWSSLIKTMVMMTSEFDYQAIFDDEHTAELSNSGAIARFIFLIFLILASIVLMNLLVGVAVSDISDLELLGNIRRLAKQVEFLSTLDILVYNKFISFFLPKKLSQSVRLKRNVAKVIEIFPGRPTWRTTKMLPSKLKDAILNKSTAQKKQIDKDTQLHSLTKMIQEIHERTINVESKQTDIILNNDEERQTKFKRRHEEITKHLNQLDDGMRDIKDQINDIKEARYMEKDVITKIEAISNELKAIRLSLSKLEANSTNK